MALTIRDDAVCIRHWDWSETSQTVSLFTRDHGVIRGLAKGSKREKAPFSGGIELLTRGEVVAIVRTTGALATLTAWDLTEAYPGVRRSLRAFYVGSYLIDLVHHALTDADPHPGLFDSLGGELARLAEQPEAALLRGQWAVLVETGQAPTPELADPAGPIWFIPREGVFRCRGVVGREGWRVRPETVGVLAGLAAAGGAEPEGCPRAGPAAFDRASRLLGSYIRHVLGRDLPSATPVFGQNGLAE